MKNKIIKIALISLTLACFPLMAQAATFNVTSLEDAVDNNLGDTDCIADTGGGLLCTLRAAIQNANQNGEADIINLTLEGDYLITVDPAGEDAEAGLNDAVGDFDITESVTINGLGADKTAISGNFNDRVLHIESAVGIQVALNDLTIKNGLITEDPAVTIFGAGIYAFDQVDLTLSNLEVINNDNQDGSGGGLYLVVNDFNINNSLIFDNSSVQAAGGGGFFVVNAGNITNTTFAENESTNLGGGIVADSRVIINYSTIINNTGEPGGISGDLFLKNSIVSGNVEVSPSQFFGGDISTQVQSLGYNIFGELGDTEQTTTDFFALEETDRYGLLNNPLNPMLGDALALNDGATRNYLPLVGSPTIDTADPLDCPATDQRGQDRNVGNGCDIGAIELQSICGNSVPEEGEVCDRGADNGLPESDCSSTCQTKTPGTADPKCGNGVIDTPEECDDGNAIDNDLCSNLCLNVATNPPGNEDSGGCAISTNNGFNYFYLSAISVILGWVVVRPRIVKQHGGNETR